MKTITEIKKVTECSMEQAVKLHDDLTKLPEELGEFVSDHLDVVNAFNADEIKVLRHYNYSKNGCNIIVDRVTEEGPLFPSYRHWKYCFDWLIDYVGVSCY